MSYDYNLYLEASSALEVERQILCVPGFERAVSGDGVVALGLLAICRPLETVPYDAEIASAFGVHRRVAVTFLPDKFDGHTDGIRNMITAVDALLSRVPGNLVLLGNGETGLLVRNDNGLALDGDSDFWSCYGATELMGHRFQWRSLPRL